MRADGSDIELVEGYIFFVGKGVEVELKAGC
jgi:hypothetical protein